METFFSEKVFPLPSGSPPLPLGLVKSSTWERRQGPCAPLTQGSVQAQPSLPKCSPPCLLGTGLMRSGHKEEDKNLSKFWFLPPVGICF